ncbi:MAG TPA: peptidylprolyl isomerase [Acidobacteriaceae bacterium]|nr:peptidylprolyl isomerase [Acidobacteriaceae bacterium]
MMLRVVLRTALPLALATVFCLPAAAQAASAAASSSADLSNLYGTPVEQIIARVNDRVITNSDLLRAQQQLDQDASQQNLSADELEQQQKNVLRDLIDRQLLLSKGKELGIHGDTELIKSLDAIRKQNHLDSMDDLEKAVQQQGTSYEDFKANIRDNIIAQEVIREQVTNKLLPSQTEFKKYYEAHKQEFAQQESIRLSEILIPTPADASDAQLTAAESQAKDIETKLQAGADFAQLAKQDSGGPTAQQGGDLGEFHRGALAKVLENQTFNLPVGGYTQPIRTKQGYVILKVVEHIPGGIPTLQQVEPQVEQAVFTRQMEPAIRQYLTRLREEAYIDIRPGYVDSGASANETKPIYSAYAAPLSKKLKKKQQQEKRRAKEIARFNRNHNGKKASAPVTSASAASPAVANATTANSETPSTSSSASLVPASTQKTRKPLKKKKVKREKIRYGRAPLYTISEEQTPNASASASDATAATPAADAVLGTDAQPLGQDLTHTPGPPAKKSKTRLSDLAKQKREAKKRAPKHAKVRKLKRKKAQPPAASQDENATQKVQSAPLGLEGDTSKKKKKSKYVAAKPGEKIRMSDEKKIKSDKKKSSDTQSTPAPVSATDAPATSSSSSGSTTP